MQETEMEKKLRNVQMIAGMLEKTLGEAADMTLYAGESRLPGRYRDETVLKAAELSEKLAAKTRELAAGASPDLQAHWKYQRDIIEIHKIRVRYRKGIIEARIPMLLPHRKGKYTEYLTRPLVGAVQSFCQCRRDRGEEVPLFEHAVLCFVHCYTDAAGLRDHDNIETKHVQDVMALFFLERDDGRHLDLYDTSVQRGETATLLYLMEKGRFPEWVAERAFGGIEK